MRYPELPEPWEEVGTLMPEQQNALEAIVGCQLTYDDVNDDADVNRTEEGGVTPKSLRAYYVMGHKWVRLRNRDTEEDVILRLQTREPRAREIYVSAVISPFQNGAETTGIQLRALPIAAIAAAYTAREIGGTVNLNRTLVLGDAINDDPLKPLPQGRVTDQTFLARVGRQYDALVNDVSIDDPVRHMAELNKTSLPTVKKWLSAARKQLFLMPVAAGRKRG